jgi:fermentation-respiration switch protein FrsA (DUF1100 family)
MRARTLTFDSDGLTFEAGYVEPDSPSWTALLVHGIPGGRPAPDDRGYEGLAHALAARGIAAMWTDLRGVRSAPGDFSMSGWCRDLGAAIDAISSSLRAPLVLIGSSAGGAAVLRVAASRPDVAAVATLAAVADFGFEGEGADAVIHRFRNLGIIRDPAFPSDPAAWAREFVEIAPLDAVAGIAPGPVLIVHGDADDVVPYAHAEMLFEKAGEPKELVRISGGGHQLRKDPRAVDAVVDWLERWNRPTRPDRAHNG